LHKVETLILSTDCSIGEIQCPDVLESVVCVSNSAVCDGVADCPTGVDEIPEACGEYMHARELYTRKGYDILMNVLSLYRMSW